MRVKRVALEDHGKIALGGGQVVDDAVADGNRAIGDVLEAGNHAQQGGLTAAGRADEDEEFTGADIEIDAVDDLEAGIGLADFAEGD